MSAPVFSIPKNLRKSARIPEICGYLVFHALQARTRDRPCSPTILWYIFPTAPVFVCEICGYFVFAAKRSAKIRGQNFSFQKCHVEPKLQIEGIVFEPEPGLLEKVDP